MAQWIPKTAWKASSLNKRYGPSFITKGYPTLEPQCGLEAYASATHSVSAAAIRKALDPLRGRTAAAAVIDVRGEADRRLHPLVASAVVALHPHDILSGAADSILPADREGSEMFVLATEVQRAVNTCTALRRWGYVNVSAVSLDAVREALNGTTGKADGATKADAVDASQ